MTLQEKQNAFDKIKWYDGIRANRDTCGEYEFCGKCRKSDDYPCARAAERLDRGFVRIAVIHCRYV
jgi:hypothetical protein